MGFYNGETTLSEIIAIAIHCLSIICLLLVIYLTYERNNLVMFFSVANIGQHLSKLFRLVIFGFTMTNSPRWSCYVHAITNFLTVGMESYISMLFALRLWLMITRKNQFKMWLIEHSKILTYVFGFTVPSILSIFSILPQLIKGKDFIVPPNAENCISGYRQNAWQIILSGPGTTLPPFLFSSVFAANIVLVVCTVSTNSIMKDVKKFSTISYSSWIRMLWFGVLFGLVVVLNITGDIKNAKAMINNGTMEPGIKNISIPYYITAGVGMGVLLIFGTTAEAKKKISSLVKNSISGITSSTRKSQSHSRSMSQGFSSSNMSQNLSLAQDISITKNSVLSSTSNLNSIKVDSSFTAPSQLSQATSTGGIPKIKSGIKPKKAVGELEATLEFNKFMKSINDEVREDEENDLLFKTPQMYTNTYGSPDVNIRFYNDNMNDYPQSPAHRMLSNNITPRMMVPIQKFSQERMHQQQLQYSNQNNTSFVSDDLNFGREEKNMNKKKYNYSDIESDQATYFQATNISGYNNSIIDSYIKLDDDDSKTYQGNLSIRDGYYSEEIIYPTKLAVSKIVRNVK